MKNKKIELDVDFIGEQGRTLTKEEQQAISEFIKADKAKRATSEKRKLSSQRRLVRHRALPSTNQ